MKHPSIRLTADGGAAPYTHHPGCLYVADRLSFRAESLDDIEIIEL